MCVTSFILVKESNLINSITVKYWIIYLLIVRIFHFRSKLLKLPTRNSESKTLYKDSKGIHSHTKHMYTRNHKKSRDSTFLLKEHLHQDGTRIQEASSMSTPSSIGSSPNYRSPITKTDFSSKIADFSSKMADFSSKTTDFPTMRADISKKATDFSPGRADFSTKVSDFPSARTERTENLISPSIAEQIAIFKEEDYAKTLSVPSGNRIHLTRLVLSETSDRPKSSPDSIELEENAQVCRIFLIDFYSKLIHFMALAKNFFFPRIYGRSTNLQLSV